MGKHIKFVTFFVYKIDEITAIFSNLESGALPILNASLLRFSALKSDRRATKEAKERESGIDVEEGAVFERSP